MPKARVVGRCMLYTYISLEVLNIAGDLKLHTLIPPMYVTVYCIHSNVSSLLNITG